jgi:hypothetical protein
MPRERKGRQRYGWPGQGVVRKSGIILAGWAVDGDHPRGMGCLAGVVGGAGAVGWPVAGGVAWPDPAIRDDAGMAQTDPGGVYDAEHAENGRWAWFWTSPGGATFDSAATYATKEAALYAARAWVKRRYKG